MPNMPSVKLGRVELTMQQRMAMGMALYQSADKINRLLADNGVQYTKMEAPQGGITPPVAPAPPIAPARDWTTVAPTLPGANIKGGQ